MLRAGLVETIEEIHERPIPKPLQRSFRCAGGGRRRCPSTAGSPLTPARWTLSARTAAVVDPAPAVVRKTATAFVHTVMD